MQAIKKEAWKMVRIKEVEGLYEISNFGRIKSLPRTKHTPLGGKFVSMEKILSLTKTNSGYLSVTLSNKPFNKSFFVHILTALHFVENINGDGFINHENGDKTDNYFENLKWCDRSYNMLHAIRTGLMPTKRDRKKQPV